MSGTLTATPSPTTSQPSASYNPNVVMSEPQESSSDSDKEAPRPGDVEIVDGYGRLIIKPVGYGFDAASIRAKQLKGFRSQSNHSIEAPFRLGARCQWICFEADVCRIQCFWNPQHETQVAQNFEKKAGNILKHALCRARQKVWKPKWITKDNGKKLLHFWATDPTFLKQSENGMKARALDKGGFRHNSGATSHEDVRMKLTLERGQEAPQDEVFKITHARKAKNADGTDQRIEPRAQQTYTEFQQHKLEYCANQLAGTSMTNEIIDQQWMEKVAPPTRYETVYGMPNRACRQFPSFLQGVGATSEGAVDPKEYQEMKQKVTQLPSTLSATEARMLHMQAQIDNLLNSGPSHIPPSPEDARRSKPSRRRRS
ncbi:uncharacterized protein LOC132614665 [Lycium barbarum]|uniref:uncharacterized protein LOC132614665 n=1 Tax=Lycium barbarum TaxID=112863 RepID=UPI00293E78C4|nr:uncharacterized protein LOC132614665 [Lycium barbarum]XP_060185156.1 uncharacterized protein LOC132614665 [Lycium barbarum]XP_060185158.1 uncharacterized protein LOC132614665 [Lycium barbarum]XP_060185159.1 uncharacterized protein LOC132614665 [Lycium barbarum]XP_060185160.1 uncharacterized protein LOC132614665 [Lycium barbarum]XP_060185161.1 uncharacterized protein LOC132614665 [Lycium barbarum]XP_060185162.1 uncharacterized protein LOC132614665 [Lycium barbarum]